MIIVDTSALMAIVLGEAEAPRCMDVLEAEDDLAISAGTVAEALIVAGRRNVAPEVESLIDGLGLEVRPLTLASAGLWPRPTISGWQGVHPAGLNFGDCFACAKRGRAIVRCCLLATISDGRMSNPRFDLRSKRSSGAP